MVRARKQFTFMRPEGHAVVKQVSCRALSTVQFQSGVLDEEHTPLKNNKYCFRVALVWILDWSLHWFFPFHLYAFFHHVY